MKLSWYSILGNYPPLPSRWLAMLRKFIGRRLLGQPTLPFHCPRPLPSLPIWYVKIYLVTAPTLPRPRIFFFPNLRFRLRVQRIFVTLWHWPLTYGSASPSHIFKPFSTPFL